VEEKREKKTEEEEAEEMWTEAVSERDFGGACQGDSR